MLLLPLLLACDEDPPEVVAPEPAPAPAPAPLTHTTTSLKKDTGSCETGCSTFEATWPVFSGGGAAPINAWVQQVLSSSTHSDRPGASIEEAADAFLAGWVDFRRESPEALAWEQSVDVSVTWEGARLVVVGASESSYTGGAHGNYSSVYGVFERDTGKKLALSDLLIDGHEAKLAPLVTAALEAHFEMPLSEAGVELEGSAPPLAGTWSVSGEALTFHYNPYEIGPYAMGAPEAAVPRAALAGLLRPDSPW